MNQVRHLSDPGHKYRALEEVTVLHQGLLPSNHSMRGTADAPSDSHQPHASIAAESLAIEPPDNCNMPPTADEIREILSRVDGASGSSFVGASTSTPSVASTMKRTFEEYNVVGGFSSVTGRFTALERAGDNYWDTKGIPRHRDERMMGHYFDFSAWQDERNRQRDKRNKKGR